MLSLLENAFSLRVLKFFIIQIRKWWNPLINLTSFKFLKMIKYTEVFVWGSDFNG